MKYFRILDREKLYPAIPTQSARIAETVRKEPEKFISKQEEAIKQYFTDVIRITRPLRCATVTVKTTPTLILKPPHEWPYLIVNPELSVGVTSTFTLFSGTVTSDGNTQANPLGCANFLSAHFFLDVTAVSGSWEFIQQVIDPVTRKWIDVQSLFSVSAVGTYYSTPSSYGVVTDLAIRWTGSGSITFTLSCSLKDGMQGSSAGVSRVIYLGDNLVSPETGLPLFEGQNRIIFPVGDVAVYAVALIDLPIKIFTL